MRKYGKYEERSEAVASKRPKIKSLLLQTYFTSLLSLALCVSMFFGTTYAWFTSEVTNTANEIYAGILKVGMYKLENGSRQNLASSASNAAKLFDSNICWEPGYTALETIEIANEGDLAFKFVLSFTKGAPENGAGKSLGDVAEWFDVWVYEGANPDVDTYAQIAAAGSGWNNIGTLATLLSGKPVLNGSLEAEQITVQSADANDEVTKSVCYTIALHMRENATTDVMGKKITMNVKLVAHQMAAETDDLSTGDNNNNENNDDNDNITVASDLSELKRALDSGEKPANNLLTSDIVIQEPEMCITVSGDNINGDGKTVTYSPSANSEELSGELVDVITTSGGTIQNLTVSGNENGCALFASNLDTDLNVSNCILSGAYAFKLTGEDETQSTGHTITFADTVFDSSTVFENKVEHISFAGCTFNDLLKPHGDTTLTNCIITKDCLVLSELEAGETVTMVNCTYNGTSGINVVFRNVDGQIMQDEGGNVTFADLGEGIYSIISNG